MKAVLRRLNNWWVLSGAVALLLALLAVFLLPMLLHGLRPLKWRLLMLLGVALVWGAAAAWRLFAARRASKRLAQALAPDPAAGAVAAEGAALSKRMNEALAKLKAESRGRKDYLYSRPWYVIIGPPGAGKTTALLSSGLRFPASDAALKGIGGTRNLDFWFSDEAVLVDTAGRYTSQDSSEERDREGWNRFLALLGANRPLQPINGVMVAIGLDTLASSNAAELDRHAGIIRQRLRELRDGLGAVAPVYVMFTKADLLAGFTEFFEDLDVEGRRAVLGATLPLDAEQNPRTYALAFDGVAQSMADRAAGRIQAELDPRRRGLVIGFPGQLESMRDHVVRFLDEVFRPEGEEEPHQLRGFYFTSGVQQGTPLDALLAGVALDDGRSAPQPVPGRGRAYFLNRLLKEVIFNEAGLARPTAAARKRRTTVLTAAYAGIGTISAILLLAWSSSFVANLAYQKRVATAATAAAEQLQGLDLKQVSLADPGLADALGALDALRTLPGGYDDRRSRKFPGVPLGLGLFDDNLSKSVEQAYLGGLQRIMTPRLLLRMEAYMREARQPTVELYSALRAYRLLGGDAPPKVMRSEIGSVANWVQADWAAVSLQGGDRTELRQRLGLHLAALLADRDLGRVWPGGRRAPLDADLIGSTQNLLQQLTPGQRGYALLLDLPAAGEPWRPRLPDQKLKAFANPDQVKALSVPFLYTRQGYLQQYQKNLKGVIDRLGEDNWVLGDQGGAARVSYVSLAPEIGQYYADDYVKHWREVLNALHPADYFRQEDAARALFATPSPLATIVDQVKSQTSLGAPPVRIPRAGAAVNAAVQEVIGQDASARINAAFATLRATDVGAFVTVLKKAWSARQLMRTDPTAESVAASAMNDLRSEAVNLPSEDLHGFASEAAGLGATAGASDSADVLRETYRTTVLPACQRVTQDSFPFVRPGTGLAPRSEVTALFARDGAMQRFVEGKLLPHIETNSPTWRWRAGDPVAAALRSSPARFQEARDLRLLLDEGLQMQIYALEFSPNVRSVELRIGDTTHVFQPNDPRPRDFQWRVDGNGTAGVTFQGGSDFIDATGGPWAVFRLFGPPAKIENLRPDNVFKVTLAKGASSAAFKVVLPTDRPNPFRGGPWNFRCPAEL
jgi:type VI secretion system protein ImpL